MTDTPALEQLGGPTSTRTGPSTPVRPRRWCEYLHDEPEAASELLSSVTSLLASDLDEAEIDAVLERAGFCYDPTRDGKTNRSWLQDIARIAALHVSDGRSERE